MKIARTAPSHSRAKALIAAGCPIDFPEDLPGNPKAKGRSFYAQQLFDYAESRVLALGEHQSGYVITLRLGTERAAGTVIQDWDFVPPWEQHLVNWDYQPADVIPDAQITRYEPLLKPRLRRVLDERRLISRGRPVDGVLCGVAFQAVGKCAEGLAFGRLSLTDDAGNNISLRIRLSVDRWRPASNTVRQLCRRLIPEGQIITH